MAERKRITALHPNGLHAQYLSLKQAEQFIERGEAIWRAHDRIELIPESQPQPGPESKGSSSNSHLSCKVGSTLARAYWRDEHKDGWAAVAVAHIFEHAQH